MREKTHCRVDAVMPHLMSMLLETPQPAGGLCLAAASPLPKTVATLEQGSSRALLETCLGRMRAPAAGAGSLTVTDHTGQRAIGAAHGNIITLVPMSNANL